jgi:hypothetical protein
MRGAFRSLWKAQQKRQIWFRYADEKSAAPTNKIKRLTAKIANALREEPVFAQRLTRCPLKVLF